MVYFSTWGNFIEMLVIYFIGIFADNHNIVCDFFKTDLVKVMKSMLLVAQGNLNVYQLVSVAS